MYIEKLLLKNFGKFNNFEIDLDTGLNVIYGKNESGKSTLFSFIKGILFGIENRGDVQPKQMRMLSWSRGITLRFSRADACL